MVALVLALIAVVPLAVAFAVFFAFGHTQGPVGPYSQSDLNR